MEKLDGETCPMCLNKTLTLIEDEQDIPYFGVCYIFSMQCSSCKYLKSDLETKEMKDPVKIEFTVEKKDDLNVRIVKSSQATVKIPTLRMSVEPGVASNGYVSNIEGLINRFKTILEQQRDSAEDASARKKAKNLLKKLWKVECGDEQLKIVIEDPSGNSAIVSEKALVSKFKVKKK